MMSGTMILAILVTITPLIFPIAMSALGLLTGMVQAYIFSILAAVYIAAATARARRHQPQPPLTRNDRERHEEIVMDSTTLIAITSIITAGLTIAIGSVGPALAKVVPSRQP